MTTIPTVGPVDDRGRLLHEDDPAAQLALALAHLEAALDERGHGPGDLATIAVLTTDPATYAAIGDVLTERLAETGARPAVRTETVTSLPLPGMVVALAATTSAGPIRPEDRPARATGSSSPPVPTVRPSTGEHMSLTIPPRPTTTVPAVTDAATAALRAACDMHLPGDPGWDAARTAWNLAADQRPAAVAVPRAIEEVVAVVRAAVAAGLRVAPQSTGHGAGPLVAHGLSDVVIVRLHELTGAEVDPAAGIVRVLGGTLWAEAVAAAAEHGAAVAHGSAPDVAVAGYVLSGGVSYYGRRHGVAANTVTALEVVTPDGRLMRTDADHHPELFWALRGGGGNLGVVVAVEMALLPYADVHAGMLLWDREHAPEVVRAWAAWTRDLPESVTTSLRVMSFPPLPELPPFLSGRDLVVIDGAVLEDDERAAELLAPLRALGPEMDTFTRMPSAGLLAVHMDPPGPTPSVGDHTVLGDLREETVTAFLDEVGPGTASGLLFAELRHLGGAFARPVRGGGAVDHLRGEYAVLAVAVAPFPEAAAAGKAAAEALVARLAPWSVASRVLTFAEQAGDTGRGYDPDAWARLCGVRDTVDPARVMVANHRL